MIWPGWRRLKVKAPGTWQNRQLVGDPQAELCVLTNEEGFIEEADVVENRAANDNRGQHDRPVVHEVITKLVSAFGVESAHRDDPAVRPVIAGKIDEVAVDKADVLAVSERGELVLQLLGRPEVVSIQEGDELAARFAQPRDYARRVARAPASG